MEVRRRRRAKRPLPVAALVIVGAAALGAVFAWWVRHDGQTGPAQAGGMDGSGDSIRIEVPESDSVVDLPALAESDSWVRDVVSALSGHPRLASWLVPEDLVQRFVSTVVDLALSRSPAEHLEFMAPEGPFTALETESGPVVNPEGYRRYDVLAGVLSSLDPEAASRLYVDMLPLFREAFQELGIPDWSFEEATLQAMDNVLGVSLPTGPLDLVPSRAVYQFGNEDLEARSPLEKHLLRMGPENAGRIQSKIRELRPVVARALPNVRDG